MGAGERPPAGLTRLARTGAPLLVAALSVVAFAPALGGEFLNFDDDEIVTLNPHFRGLSPAHLRWMLTTGHMGHYQPLTWLSLALDHAAWGLSAPGYHLTSVLLHAAGAVALYFVARRLLGLASSHGDGAVAAALAALLFAVHPLRCESVVWITERRDVLSGLFFVLSIGAWLRSASPERPAVRVRPGVAVATCVAALVSVAGVVVSLDLSRSGALGLSRHAGAALGLAVPLLGVTIAGGVIAVGRPAGGVWWYGLALLCLLGSLLAKAWGITMPALLLVLDRWPLRRWRGRADLLPLVIEKLPFVVPAAVFAVLAAWAQAGQVETMARLTEHTPAERLAQAFHGLAYYPVKTLLPVGLVPLHDLPESLSLLEPRFAAAALAVASVTIALVRLRAHVPAALAAWAAYAVVISPVLGLVQSGPQLVADRYSYLACMPFALLAAGLWQGWRAPAPVRWGLPAAVVLALGVLTWRETRVWRTSASLWEHAAALRPASPVVRLNLAAVYAAEAAETTDASERAQLLRRLRRLYGRTPTRDRDPRFLANLALVEATLADVDPGRRDRHLARALRMNRRALALARRTGHFVAEVRRIHDFVVERAGRGQPAR